MLGLTDTAVIFKQAGRRNGAPQWDAVGAPCACRVEQANAYQFSGNSVERIADTRILISGGDCAPGDRVQVNARTYIAAQVNEVRAFGRTHHIEILCKAAEDA